MMESTAQRAAMTLLSGLLLAVSSPICSSQEAATLPSDQATPALASDEAEKLVFLQDLTAEAERLEGKAIQAAQDANALVFAMNKAQQVGDIGRLVHYRWQAESLWKAAHDFWQQAQERRQQALKLHGLTAETNPRALANSQLWERLSAANSCVSVDCAPPASQIQQPPSSTAPNRAQLGIPPSALFPPNPSIRQAPSPRLQAIPPVLRRDELPAGVRPNASRAEGLERHLPEFHAGPNFSPDGPKVSAIPQTSPPSVQWSKGGFPPALSLPRKATNAARESSTQASEEQRAAVVAAAAAAQEFAAESLKIDALVRGSAAVSAPGNAKAGEVFSAYLRVSPDKLQALLKSLQADFPENTTLKGKPNIRLTPRMKAELTGFGFDIAPKEGVLQAVSATEETTWQWQVKPVESGQLALMFTLKGAVTVESKEVERNFYEYQQKVVVAVSPMGFVQKYWQWIVTTLALPAVGALWALFRKPKGSSQPQPPPLSLTDKLKARRRSLVKP